MPAATAAHPAPGADGGRGHPAGLQREAHGLVGALDEVGACLPDDDRPAVWEVVWCRGHGHVPTHTDGCGCIERGGEVGGHEVGGIRLAGRPEVQAHAVGDEDGVGPHLDLLPGTGPDHPGEGGRQVTGPGQQLEGAVVPCCLHGSPQRRVDPTTGLAGGLQGDPHGADQHRGDRSPSPGAPVGVDEVRVGAEAAARQVDLSEHIAGARGGPRQLAAVDDVQLHGGAQC